MAILISGEITLPDGIPDGWMQIAEALADEYGLRIQGVVTAPNRIALKGRIIQSATEAGVSLFDQWPQFLARLEKKLRQPLPPKPTRERSADILFFASGLLASVAATVATETHDQNPIRQPWVIGLLVLSATLSLVTAVRAARRLRSNVQRIQQKQDELAGRINVATAADAEDKADATRSVLQLRATLMRGDLPWLRGRSRWLTVLGVSFLLAALALPTATLASTVFHGQVMTVNLGSYLPSGVALAAAALLFRYDAKIREQYQVLSSEIAYLDRAQLALDCARAVSQSDYEKALRRIVLELLGAANAKASADRLTASAATSVADAASEQGGVVGAVIGMAETAVGKAVDGITAIASSPTKPPPP